MNKENINRVIIAASEMDSDLFYATHFLAPDAFLFVSIQGKKFLVMSDLEIDRAKSQASVDEVLSLSEYAKRAREKKPGICLYAEIAALILEEHQQKQVYVPQTFPVLYADYLRKRGIDLVIGEDPFYIERLIKSDEEIVAIRESLKHTEDSMGMAIEMIKAAKVVNGRLERNGKSLTSEDVRTAIHLFLMERDMVGQHTIVAGGEQCVDPHNVGSGPLYANQTIIFDIFPRSSHSRYFADMSRTVVKGKASDAVKKMYDTVHEGMNFAFNQAKDGASGKKIHMDICQYFESKGFKTGIENGRMQGFFHSTGHGVGLDIHELPRISQSDYILKKNHVVTVEPGLYYQGIGGIRIEDMILIRENDNELLTQYPKVLEV